MEWLQSRLSPVKSQSDRWISLAQSIEKYWSENYDSDFARLIALQSIFTASTNDQMSVLSELGKYYDIDLPKDSVPIAVVQRRVELLQKDSLVPLANSLRRACTGIKISWMPEYAPSNAPYGSQFYTWYDLVSRGITSWLDDTINYLDGTWAVGGGQIRRLTESMLYMASRGKLSVDGDSVESANIMTPDAAGNLIRRHADMLIPLHIVYDGTIWTYHLDAPVNPLSITEFSQIYSRVVLPKVWDVHHNLLDGSLNVDGAWVVMDNAAPFVTSASEIVSSDYLGISAVYLLDGTLQVDGTWFVVQPTVGVDLTAYIDGTLFVDGSWDVGGLI